MDSPMEHDCLKPAEMPHLTRLYADFLSWRVKRPASGKIQGFYPHHPSLAGVKEAARELKRSPAAYPAEMRAAVSAVLREQNARFNGSTLPPKLEINLASLESGAVAIVTGQQVGMFGGPAYTFYKAISAVNIASQLTKSGLKAVPIFWMASEDHDLAEVNHVNWPSASGLSRVEWIGAKEFDGRSVGNIPFGGEIEVLVKQAADSLAGPGAGDIEEILRAAYRPGETFGTSFGRMMAALFSAQGLILLDPMDARLHKLAAPLLRRAVEEQSGLTQALLAQNKLIEKAGYHAQVKVTERSSLLFTTVDGKRVALLRRNSGFAAGEKEMPASELCTAIEAHPESFSPNALLRPVMQDTLLPTAAYIGGPAEIAYFAQNKVLYERLLGRSPAILPRASFTLVEQPVGRLLARYGLAAKEVFRGRQYLRAKMERQHLPPGLASRFSAEEKKLAHLVEEMRKPLAKLDSTLVGALDTAKRKMLYQFGKLRAKSGRAADMRTGILSRHEQTIREALYPHNDFQERSLSLLPFLARNGIELLDQLGRESGPDSEAHCIVRL